MGRTSVGAFLFVGLALAAITLWPKLSLRPDGMIYDRPFYAHKQTSNPLRIVVFGTSISARAKWPDALASALQNCGLGRVQVLRHVKAGANSSWGLSQADWLGQQNPDLVIVEFAINDADILDGLSMGDSRRNHDEIIRSLQKHAPHARIMLLSTNPVTGLARLKRPFLSRYYDAYVAISDETNIGMIDGYGRWLQLQGWHADMPDGVHPLPDIDAQLLTLPIARAIASGFGATCPTDAGQVPTD